MGKRQIHIHIHSKKTDDAPWRSDMHPRKPNGQFGHGSGDPHDVQAIRAVVAHTAAADAHDREAVRKGDKHSDTPHHREASKYHRAAATSLRGASALARDGNKIDAAAAMAAARKNAEAAAEHENKLRGNQP